MRPRSRVAPAALAICTAALPTPPAAPSTSTVSPALQRRAVDQGVVRGAVGERESGSVVEREARRQRHAPARASTQACVREAAGDADGGHGGRRPSGGCTPSPTASTTPENSLPGTKGSGGLTWYLFCTSAGRGSSGWPRGPRCAPRPAPGSGVGSFRPPQGVDADRVLAQPGMHRRLLSSSDDRRGAMIRTLRVSLPTIAPMRILIANDDGYLAPGLAALVQAMQGLGEIDVIAPEQNASGTSNALTLNRPLSVFEARRRSGFQVHQRHAVGLRARGPDRPAAAAPGPGALGHQQRRQHGRRHAVLGHRGRGDGRLPVRHPGDRLLAGRQGLGRARRAAAVARARGRAGAGRPPAAAAVAAQCEHPEPRRCGVAAAADHPPGPPPCQRAGDPADQPARRDDLLDRPGRRRARGRRGHRLPCHRQRLRLDHAACRST